MHPARVKLFIARAQAIDHYARYEAALSRVFAQLLDVPLDYAGVPFFKINNARARIEIVQRLLEKRHEATYKKFWESLGGKLRILDDERNHIVHWVVLVHIDAPSGQITDATLVQPNIFDKHPSETKHITVSDLNEFTNKAKFFTALVAKFHQFLHKKDDVPAAWHDIFLQRVTYPPKDSHPIFLKKKALGIQPLPSPE